MRDVFKYVLNMKRLPILIIIIVAGSFLAFQSMGTSTPPDKYQKILQLVGEMMKQAHFSPKDLNDEFSQKIFDRYIDELDPEKNIFLASDIDSLRSRYGNKIDDEMRGAPVEFFKAAGDVFNRRMEEAAQQADKWLSQPFSFTKDERVQLEGDKLVFAADRNEIRERWRISSHGSASLLSFSRSFKYSY